jgi:hypothetical protein
MLGPVEARSRKENPIVAESRIKELVEDKSPIEKLGVDHAHFWKSKHDA